ncbi:MAG: AAA family ATPase [Myxococcales bacterium]|nr:AAA family ATPase [Myxococcales bacterium]
MVDPATTNLRPSLSRLVGRARELEQLAELVAAGQRLVTVFGPAGTGKTRTALALAHRLQAEQPDLGEVWLCELADTRDLEGLCEAIARTLGVPPLPSSSDAEVVQRLGAAIAARGPVLLVLDNFEQLAPLAGSTVAVWLAEAPELRLVVTSREHLRLRGELRFELPPLRLPEPGEPPEQSEAVALLVDRVRALDPGFELDATTTPLVVDLVTRLEGLPLAIELAASQVELLGLQGLLDNLHKRLDVLVGDGRDVADRHATLRAAIDWSWGLLSPVEREVLAQCTVFAGGFTAEVVAAVIETPPGGPAPLSVLKALRDKSLLRRDVPVEHPGQPRFLLFEAVREFAAERFASPAARDEARARHATCFLDLAERCVAQVGTPQGPQALRTLALERDNLRAVHEYASDRATTSDDALAWALRCVLALDVVASIRGPLAAHLALLEQTMARGQGRAVDDRLWARALRARAKARLMHGQTASALRDLDEALARAQAAGDAELQAEILVDQGVHHHQHRRLEQARADKKAEKGRALGLAAAGWSLLGSTYLMSALIGTISIDVADGDARLRRFGTWMTVPVAGPFAAAFNARSATGTLFTTTLGLAQAAGFTMALIGTSRHRRAKRDLQLMAMPTRGGGHLGVRMRF